jgi:aryl-alcohol dehydrogenase-like predicted oxidoreductase
MTTSDSARLFDPKIAHLEENVAVAVLTLSEEDLAEMQQ